MASATLTLVPGCPQLRNTKVGEHSVAMDDGTEGNPPSLPPLANWTETTPQKSATLHV
ncbi:hypothetical protein LZ32DRAFT_605628 [Colletotrichum eremochloae]|nr:hypothetical protein LZ32DRAFT_605628 [Colletotrichum eremochloae]